MDGDRKKSPSKSLAEIKAAARAQQRRSPKKQPPGNGSGDASVDDLAVEMVGMSLSERTKAPMPDNKVFVARGKTGVAFDVRMGEQHRCWADPSHSEKPERVKAILERISGTLETHKDSIKRIEGREDQKVLEEDIKRVHTEELFKLLAKTPTMTRAEMRDVAEEYDSVYFDEDTCELALTAADLTISLVDAVIRGDIQNGMAIVRPPGHHAMPDEFNGFCFLNNVAIAAKRALHVHGLKRILVVDWDVHHGQGIQRAFYNDPRVLYFSTHRYERAKFWPHLKESDYDSVGEGTGKGYTVNFPLDQVGVGDADFLAIWYRILLPVAYEYDPDLVIVSAGYDAALGCPEGQMRLTPEAYAHLVKPLMGLAGGKIAVVLEGGYCLDSLAESAYHTLNTLIGVPCPLLSRVDGVAPSPGIEDMIHRSWSVLKQYWKCFSWLPDRELPKLENFGLDPTDHFITESEPYEKQDGMTKEQLSWMLKRLKFEVAEKLRAPPKDGFKSVGVVHDSQMLKHIAPSGMHHPEKPERLTESWESLKDHGLRARCRLVRSRPATELELRLVHTAEHLQYMEELGAKATTDAKFCDILNVKSLYACSTTDQAAKLAAGSCLQVLEAVLNNDVETAFAIVRPPGHHAEPDAAFGFCFYNNVAVMAAYALRVYNLKRVLIIDWDVHHGNGIQSAFYSDPRVLYISVHRFGARFFPASPEGNYDHIGEGPGVGFNVNVPWNADGCRKKFGAPDYLAAFLQIVMPIAYEFDPELVLVSSGFDALERDPVEEKVCLFPDVFAHLTHLLSPLARGKVVMALEGGYRIDGVGLSVARCVSTLLGDPLPRLSSERVGDWTVNPRAGTSLRNVASVLNSHWKNLKLIGATTSTEKLEPTAKE